MKNKNEQPGRLLEDDVLFSSVLGSIVSLLVSVFYSLHKREDSSDCPYNCSDVLDSAIEHLSQMNRKLGPCKDQPEDDHPSGKKPKVKIQIEENVRPDSNKQNHFHFVDSMDVMKSYDVVNIDNISQSDVSVEGPGSGAAVVIEVHHRGIIEEPVLDDGDVAGKTVDDVEEEFVELENDGAQTNVTSDHGEFKLMDDEQLQEVLEDKNALVLSASVGIEQGTQMSQELVMVKKTSDKCTEVDLEIIDKEVQNAPSTCCVCVQDSRKNSHSKLAPNKSREKEASFENFGGEDSEECFCVDVDPDSSYLLQTAKSSTPKRVFVGYTESHEPDPYGPNRCCKTYRPKYVCAAPYVPAPVTPRQLPPDVDLYPKMRFKSRMPPSPYFSQEAMCTSSRCRTIPRQLILKPCNVNTIRSRPVFGARCLNPKCLEQSGL